MKLFPLQQQHWDWVYERAHPVWCADTQGIVAMRGPYLVAAVVFDSWTDNSCLAHIVIEDPRATRRLLRAGFHHAFVTADRGIIYGLTPAGNEVALRFNKRVGFTELYRLKDGYRKGMDMVLQELRKENCRWITSEHRIAEAA